MSQENVEVVRAGFEAWNAGDMDAFRELLAPEVTLRPVEDWPEPGPYVGQEPVMRWLGQLRDAWDGVPIFILSRQEPGIDTGQWPLVTYVSDVETAINKARQAAGDKNVLVHGAATAPLALAAGVLDELEIHLIPVLLGQGRRLFDHLGPEQIELERTRILEGEDGVTHVHYRVQR